MNFKRVKGDGFNSKSVSISNIIHYSNVSQLFSTGTLFAHNNIAVMYLHIYISTEYVHTHTQFLFNKIKNTQEYSSFH